MSHLQEFNVGYFAHMWRALGFFAKCICWSSEVLVHAIIPDLFTGTSTRMKQEIQRLEEE